MPCQADSREGLLAAVYDPACRLKRWKTLCGTYPSDRLLTGILSKYGQVHGLAAYLQNLSELVRPGLTRGAPIAEVPGSGDDHLHSWPVTAS